MKSKRLFAAAAAIALLAPLGARANIVLNMTTTGAQQADLNGAIYAQTDAQPTGTGNIRSFVRVQQTQSDTKFSEEGYNTDRRPVQFDEYTDPNFTRSVLITQVPVVSILGVDYRQFLLDINQNNGNGNLLSLNRVEIYLTDNPSITGFDPNAPVGTGFGSSANLVYSLDGGLNGDGRVELDYDLNGGSGEGDMFLYVRNDLFLSAFDGSGINVVLYSQFGTPPGPNSTNDGFEEWATLGVGPTLQILETPEPASLAMALSGAIPLGLWVVRRRKRATA